MSVLSDGNLKETYFKMAMNGVRQSLPNIKEQAAMVVGNSSVVVKFLCVAVVFGYFISFSKTLFNSLALTPGYVLPPHFCYWTFITYPFLEAHIWNVMIDILVIFLSGKLVEPLWGAQEMLFFFVVVSVLVGICSTGYYLLAYVLFQSTDVLFVYRINGLAGYVGAFSVAVKQTMPDHVIINSPFGKLRNRHVPSYVLLLAIVVRLLKIQPPTFPVMCGLGILTSWTYLRYYQRHSNGNKGDVAESFSFAR